MTVTAICREKATLSALGQYLQSRVSFRGVLDIEAALGACAGSDTVILYPQGFLATAVQRLLRKLISNHTISLVTLMCDDAETDWLSSRLLSSESRLVVLPAQVLPSALLAIIQASVPLPRSSCGPIS